MSKQKSATHEPFIRMSKRDGMPLWKSLGIRLIGLTISLIICAVIIYALTKLNPLRDYDPKVK